MKDVAVVSYCRTGIARAQRGALNQTHGIPIAAHVMQQAVARAGIEAGENYLIGAFDKRLQQIAEEISKSGPSPNS